MVEPSKTLQAVFDKVVKDESKWNFKGRSILLRVSKKDKE